MDNLQLSFDDFLSGAEFSIWNFHGIKDSASSLLWWWPSSSTDRQINRDRIVCTIRFIVVKGYLSNHWGFVGTLCVQGATFYFINICHFSLNTHNHNNRHNNYKNNNKSLALVFADYNNDYNDSQTLNADNEQSCLKSGSCVISRPEDNTWCSANAA